MEKALGRAFQAKETVEAQAQRPKEHCVYQEPGVAGVQGGRALEAGWEKALSLSSTRSCFPVTAST